MPKDTFFNLPEEKREKIMEAALSEFETYAYDQASVNRIVQNADISKGSFYQYFEDKKDLYKYLLNLIVQEKLKYITPSMMKPFEHGFFEVIHDMNAMGLEFAKNNPRYLKIGNLLLKDNGSPIFEEVMQSNQAAAYQAYEMLLKRGIESGEIREDVDVKFVARIMFKLSSELLVDELDFESDQLPETSIKVLDRFMNFIMYGIKK